MKMPHARGRKAIPRRAHSRLAVEELESRYTPAVHGALNGTTLTVTANAANDQAALRVSGANIRVVDDAANVTVFSTAAANVQGISAAGNDLAGQSLSLEGVLLLPDGVWASGWARIIQTGSYNVSTGGYEANASESIALTPGAGISATDGDISLSANMQSTPSAGDFVGIDVNGATITTSHLGRIDLQGRGGNAANTASHVGVHLHGGAIVSSTTPVLFPPIALQPGRAVPDVYPIPHPFVVFAAGDISITGSGGQGTGGDAGVLIEDANTSVTSLSTEITITGTGGQSAADGETGVVVRNGASVG
jgi:hypothetical protein